jgi:outer membrane protein TolC
VIRAERAIRDQENVLKRLITYDLGNWLEKRIVPAERPKENYQAQPATASIGEALQQRADLKEAVQRAEQQNIQVKYAQNQLLPQLDLRASYGYAGRDLEIDRSFGNAAKADDPQWFVGLFLEVPFGNREQRGRLEAAKLTKEQTLLELKRLEQTIIVEVDNAAGQVETNRQRVVAARAAREFAEESLKAEQEKLQAGTSTSYVVLQLQRDLTEARIRELRAMADLEKSRAELLRVQGTAFRHYSIILDKTTP